mmetsp:Transcript_19914/g.30551  ORF Transcript_19914/g.30551 Transcript_19914/m.30551 type:complete len:92 (-) Transcript_19914:84-359(-)
MRDSLCRNHVFVVYHYRVGDFHSRLRKVNQTQQMYHAWPQQVHNMYDPNGCVVLMMCYRLGMKDFELSSCLGAKTVMIHSFCEFSSKVAEV